MISDATSRIHAYLARYGYPDELGYALERICEVLAPLQPRAVLLLGSAARGELTYRLRDGRKLEMFSDLELVCLTDHATAAQKDIVEAGLRELERELFVPNSFFHLDCLITPKMQGGKHNRGLLWFEGGTRHEVLIGSSEPHFGEVRHDSVSLELINQLLIVRLWWLLFHFPSRLLGRSGRELEEVEREDLMYAQIRNILDIPSIWLPNEGVYVTGYRDRLAYLREHFEDLFGTRFLPPQILEDVAEATRRKLECDLSGDPIDWYTRNIAAYEGLVRLLLEEPADGAAADLVPAIRHRWALRHAAPRSLRFKAYATALTVRYVLKGRNPLWLSRRGHPEAAALAFLVSMHRAATAKLNEDDCGAADNLAAARESLWRFAAETPPPSGVNGGFDLEWDALRSAFVEPLVRYFRGVRGSAPRIRRHLEAERERLHR